MTDIQSSTYNGVLRERNELRVELEIAQENVRRLRYSKELAEEEEEELHRQIDEAQATLAAVRDYAAAVAKGPHPPAAVGRKVLELLDGEGAQDG